MNTEKRKTIRTKLAEKILALWRQKGKASVIAAKHAEFVVEPTVFIGNELNPEILKLLVVNYLKNCSKQDSGTGNIDVSPEKLVIKSPKGTPLVIVRDKKIIFEYLTQKA